MNPTGCRIVLRPRSAFEVLDLAARFAQEDAWVLLRMMGVVVLPAWLLACVVGVATATPYTGLALLLILSPLLQLPFTLLGARRLFDDTVTVRQVLRMLPDAWRALLARGLAAAAVAVLSVFTVGLMWLPMHVSLLFLGETVALERAGLRDGATRALRLAADQAVKATLGGLLTLALGAWCVLAAEAGAQALVGFVLQLGQPFGSVLQGHITPYVLLGVALAQPAMAWFRLLLYLDVRTALEGWDLQVALKAAAEGA